jgi:hypothetical protein
MKKAIIAIAFAGIFAACNSNSKTSEASQLASTDTTGLHQFQLMKQQQAIQEQLGQINANGINDGMANSFASNNPGNLRSYNDRQETYEEQPGRTVTRVVYRDRPVYIERGTARTSRSSTSRRSSSGSGRVSSGSGGTYSHSTASIPARKKGWSKAAKGAVIGGGSGAVLGAIISKNNKAKGAVIGGVLGAGGGYVLGRVLDKKDGRY